MLQLPPPRRNVGRHPPQDLPPGAKILHLICGASLSLQNHHPETGERLAPTSLRIRAATSDEIDEDIEWALFISTKTQWEAILVSQRLTNLIEEYEATQRAAHVAANKEHTETRIREAEERRRIAATNLGAYGEEE